MSAAESGVSGAWGENIEAPWEGSLGFTLRFEAFAINVSLAAGSVEQARKCLRVSWKQAHDIMARAVEEGLVKRKLEQTHVRARGIFEKPSNAFPMHLQP